MAAIRRNPELSKDLIDEILVRVPVKSLLRLQLVCKTWLSLIKSPAFVKSQLRHAITTQTDQTLVITPGRKDGEIRFLLLRVDSREIDVDLNYPYSQDEFSFTPISKLVGSVNGILCVSTTGFDRDFLVRRSMYLWNPAIRQSKHISLTNDGASGFGFGYDSINDDYKVVTVVPLDPHSSAGKYLAWVYSANKNVWRKLPDPTDYPLNYAFEVCVSGYLFGIGNYGMMTFDLNKEVLSCNIKLPVVSDYHGGTLLLEFNNSVSVVILSKGMGAKISIWTLNDNACLSGGGVEASWTPMFTIGLVTPGWIFFGYFNNRDLQLLALTDGYKWISCNADRKEAKIVPLSDDMAAQYNTSHAYKYKESLVSLAGFKQVDLP